MGGFDVIIEHLANINLGHDVQMLKRDARIMVVGCRGSVNINPRHLMLPEASIRGVTLQGNTTVAQYKEIGSAIVAGIEAGWVNPVINKEYAMEEAQQVHYDIIHSKGAKGKLVLKVGKESVIDHSFMQLKVGEENGIEHSLIHDPSNMERDIIPNDVNYLV